MSTYTRRLAQSSHKTCFQVFATQLTPFNIIKRLLGASACPKNPSENRFQKRACPEKVGTCPKLAQRLPCACPRLASFLLPASFAKSCYRRYSFFLERLISCKYCNSHIEIFIDCDACACVVRSPPRNLPLVARARASSLLALH